MESPIRIPDSMTGIGATLDKIPTPEEALWLFATPYRVEMARKEAVVAESGERFTFGDGIAGWRKQAITQQLDHPAPVFLEGLGQRAGQLRDEATGGFIAKAFEEPCASDQVRKNDSSHDASAYRGMDVLREHSRRF